MLTSPKDPLLASGPDRQRELFMKLCREADGFSSEDVLGAAINLIVNGIRQAYASRDKADTAIEQKLAQAKALLDQHYDGMGKRRNGLFPFHQVIQIPRAG